MNNQYTFTMTAEQLSVVIKLLEPYAVLSASLSAQFAKQHGTERAPAMPPAPPEGVVKARKLTEIAEEKQNV